MRGIVAAGVVFGLWLSPAASAAQPVGGVGESCRARADCEEGLRCIDHVCTGSAESVSQAEEFAEAGSEVVESAGTPGGQEEGVREPEGEEPAEGEFELSGAHGFAGLVLGPALTGENLPNDWTAMQGRLDLVGLVYRYEHFLFELALFCPRFSSEFRNFGLWVVPFSLAASYAF